MPTYHVELRDFPRTLTRFNQSGQQLGAIVLPWVENRIVEMDDDKWAPWESTITILEGPSIPLGGLSMGRGWKTALREGSDVTDRVLDEARRAIADGSAYVQAPAENDAPPAAAAEPATAEPAVDYPSGAPDPSAAPAGTLVAAHEPETATASETAELLGSEPQRLLATWRAVAARTAGLAPSESLALAERELQGEARPEH
jgi:hypothetical protein